jgi:hypothetical protein
MSEKLRALIVGQSLELMMAMPATLGRAGFDVDAISTDKSLKKSRFILNFIHAENPHIFLKKLREENFDDYDFIIPCDDETLGLIKDSDFTIAQKLKLLPIKNEKNFAHIFSKIELSKTLSKAGVNTPQFEVAQGLAQVLEKAEKIGYPLMLKTNSANGGNGVFECETKKDFEKIDSRIFENLVLIQKKIIGCELDLSALYRDEKLIYFTFSKIEKVIGNKFGPSSLRSYEQLSEIDEKLFFEMQQLGAALGANGFVTISCMESFEDKKRYFIEADMRPNSWVQFGKFFGNDVAIKIAKWFLHQEVLQFPIAANKKFPTKNLLPYFNRMSFAEIFSNRYGVLKYLPFEDYKILFFLLRQKFYFEIFIPKKRFFLKSIEHIPTKIGRFLIRDKELRVKIRLTCKQLIKNSFAFIANKLCIFKKAHLR